MIRILEWRGSKTNTKTIKKFRFESEYLGSIDIDIIDIVNQVDIRQGRVNISDRGEYAESNNHSTVRKTVNENSQRVKANNQQKNNLWVYIKMTLDVKFSKSEDLRQL